MAAQTLDPESNPDAEGTPDGETDGAGGTMDATAVASVVLSAAGFFTLLKLADRRDRSPARALGLFLATSLESVGGTVLGLRAVGRAREVDRPNLNLLVAAAGAVLGVVTTLLNLNFMRSRRRL